MHESSTTSFPKARIAVRPLSKTRNAIPKKIIRLAHIARVLAGSSAISAPAASSAGRSCGDHRQRRYDHRGMKAARSNGSAFRTRERDTTVLLTKVPHSPAIAISRKGPAPFDLAACPNLLARYQHENRNHPAYFEDCSETRQEFSPLQENRKTSGIRLPNAMFLRLTAARYGLHPTHTGRENTRRGSFLPIF